MLVVVQCLLPSLILIETLYLQRVLTGWHSLQHLGHLSAIGDVLSLQHTDAVLLEHLIGHFPSVGILVERRVHDEGREVELTCLGLTGRQQCAECFLQCLSCCCNRLFA